MTTPKRYAQVPNVPTIVEELPAYESIVDWFAFFGPAGLARPIVTRLNAAMLEALGMPDVRSALESQSLQIIASSPEDLAETIRRELPVYAKAVKAAGIQPE